MEFLLWGRRDGGLLADLPGRPDRARSGGLWLGRADDLAQDVSAIRATPLRPQNARFATAAARPADYFRFRQASRGAVRTAGPAWHRRRNPGRRAGRPQRPRVDHSQRNIKGALRSGRDVSAFWRWPRGQSLRTPDGGWEGYPSGDYRRDRPIFRRLGNSGRLGSAANRSRL